MKSKVLNINRHNKDLGDQGELLAMNHYILKNYTLLSKNSRARNSEIDLVFIKDKEILFAEVKTVQIDVTHESKMNIKPEDNFTYGKRQKFKRGINRFLYEYSKKNKSFDIEKYQININLACVYKKVNNKIAEHRVEWSIKIYNNIILD